MIEAVSLVKTFEPPRGEPVCAVKGVSFAVKPGEVFGLLGPNGAGKTSLLRMLGTIITPTSGHSLVDGVRGDENPEAVRRQIGFMSGNTKLYRRLTGRETLAYFGKLYGMSQEAIEAGTKRLIDGLDMSGFIDRRCESYSTGQAQRVSIARVILHDPKVLILDEPTLGLDIMSCQAILGFIREAKQRGRAVIFSTHYMTEAESLCDRIGFLYAGELLAEGTTQSLFEQTQTQTLQDAFFKMAGLASVAFDKDRNQAEVAS